MKTNGRRILFAELPEAARAWFLAVANSDFSAALQSADDALLYRDHPRLRQQLAELAIIRFTKPFGPCNLSCGRHETRLPKNFNPREVPGTVAAFVKEAIDLRNQLLAHSDMSRIQAGFAVMLMASGKVGVTALVDHVDIPDAGLVQLQHLTVSYIEAIRAEVLETISRRAQEIQDEPFLPAGDCPICHA